MMGSVSFVLYLFLPCLCLSQLSLTSLKCGEQRCEYGEFCSETDRSCKSCARICNVSHHNYEEKNCMDNCADYILDTRYVKKSDSSDGKDWETIKGLSAAVHRLSNVVYTTLTLVVVLIILLCGLLAFQAYRWKVKKNITWKNLKSKIFNKSDQSTEVKMGQNTPQKNHGKPDLRLDISNSASITTDHSPMTAMTSISRRPAEDSAVGYAYDNHAMSNSPSQRSSPGAKF